MSLSTCIRFNTLTHHHHHHHVRSGFHTFNVPVSSSSRFQSQFQSNHLQISAKCLHLRCVRNDDPHGLSDTSSSFIEQEDSGESNQSQGKSSSSSELTYKGGFLMIFMLGLGMVVLIDGSWKTTLYAHLWFKMILKKLGRYGIAWILSYWLLIAVYHLSVFLVVLFYIPLAPEKLGFFTTVKRFSKLIEIISVGSQVTKLLGAGGALALALSPVVAKVLTWFMAKVKFKSLAKVFMVIVGCCFGPVAVLFLVMTLLSA